MINSTATLCIEGSMDEYLKQCRKLSLTARMAIALLVFERFCSDNLIECRQTKDLSEHLWQWPLIDGPDQFEPWEQSRPELVDYGLGDGATKVILSVLEQGQVEESKFRDIVGGLVEILWGSFWGASENEQSLKSLSIVLNSANLDTYPPLTPFRFSLFSERSGWGQSLTKEDRDYWRSCSKNA